MHILNAQRLMGFPQQENEARTRPAVRGRRSKFDILETLLQLASAGSTKTALVYGSNLNFKIVEKYIDQLIRDSLLDVQQVGGQVYYRTSAKGAEALRAITTAMDLVSRDHALRRDRPLTPRWVKLIPSHYSVGTDVDSSLEAPEGSVV